MMNPTQYVERIIDEFNNMTITGDINDDTDKYILYREIKDYILGNEPIDEIQFEYSQDMVLMYSLLRKISTLFDNLAIKLRKQRATVDDIMCMIYSVILRHDIEGTFDLDDLIEQNENYIDFNINDIANSHSPLTFKRIAYVIDNDDNAKQLLKTYFENDDISQHPNITVKCCYSKSDSDNDYDEYDEILDFFESHECYAQTMMEVLKRFDIDVFDALQMIEPIDKYVKHCCYAYNDERYDFGLLQTYDVYQILCEYCDVFSGLHSNVEDEQFVLTDGYDSSEYDELNEEYD